MKTGEERVRKKTWGCKTQRWVTHARLRVEAARHGRSMEAEVRAILQKRLMPRAGERGLGSRIRARFQGLEGDLELPDRSGELPRAAEFGP